MEQMKAKVKRVTPSGFVIYEGTEIGRRWDWLNEMICSKQYHQGVGAEIGCHSGRTTTQLLLNNLKLRMYAVDLWNTLPEGSGQYDDWHFKKTKREFRRNTMKCRNRLTVLQGVSWEMADKVKDNSLDFIFIDADHAYESVIKDILAWTPKLKAGGMITGHDTHFSGVKKAIDELIPNWKVAGVDNVWYANKEDVIW